MTRWIDRFRRQAEDRYRRLDAVLAPMPEPPTAARAPTSGEHR